MLGQKKTFLFDIDGTLAVDADLYDGTRELLSYIEEIGGQAFYITNNSTKSRKDYVEKFKCWGIEACERQFVTASYAACCYLKEIYGNAKLFVLGTPSFILELREFGLCVTEEVEKDVVCVVVGFDATLTYEKVNRTCELLFRPDIDFVGTNPDYRCPTWYGFMPDCGGICEMLKVTTDRTPYYVGKPNAKIVELCMETANTTKEEIIVIGDRLYTDIACGIEAGVDTALVFTGEAKAADLMNTPYQPSCTFETIRAFYTAFKEEKEQG